MALVVFKIDSTFDDLYILYLSFVTRYSLIGYLDILKIIKDVFKLCIKYDKQDVRSSHEYFFSSSMNQMFVFCNIQMMVKEISFTDYGDKLCIFLVRHYTAYTNGKLVVFLWCVFRNKIIEKSRAILWGSIM